MKIESWNIEEETGYTPMTTFYEDLSIADNFGSDAIKNTFEIICKDWITDYKYFTEFIMALNWKCWRWYKDNNEYSMLYSNLFYKAKELFYKEYSKDKEIINYFWELTD